MNNIFLAFILTIIAGFSTMIGTIFVFIKRKNDKILISSLGFAAGVMITVSLTDLMPESYNLLKNIYPTFPRIIYILIFMVTGIILSMLIDKYLPENCKNNNKSLYRVGIISMLAIILHNIPEGIATFMATNSNVKLGISLAVAIAFQDFSYFFIRKPQCLLQLHWIACSNFINDRIMGFLFSIIAGIMIHISIYELIPASLNYKNNKLTYLFLLIGSLFMIINHFIF